MLSDFTNRLLQRLDFPVPARMALADAAQKMPELSMYQALLKDEKADVADLADMLDKAAAGADVRPQTAALLLLTVSAERLLEQYRRQGIDEDIFWDTAADLRVKMMEYYQLYEAWGTSELQWLTAYFRMSRFALGCFQYDISVYSEENPYSWGSVTISKGERIYDFHLPSGGSIPREVRMDSYKKAHRFFGHEVLPLIFHSWLLYPAHRDFLPPHSNILDFMLDFDIIDQYEEVIFSNAWRVFGKDHTRPYDQLPTDTSLRRAYAKRLQEGKPTGTGTGVILFDGEKIINTTIC